MIKPAYAKVNLTLSILGKREDGFHNIQSILQTVRLCDLLHFSPGGKVTVTTHSPHALTGDLPEEERNLVFLAAEALARGVATPKGARIHLEKLVPVGAGLGGGSSDAACALRWLSEIWETGLSREALENLASGLGADVPFGLGSGTALVQGTGTEITRLPDSPEMWILILVPEGRVSTQWAYQEWDERGLTSSRPEAAQGMQEALASGDVASIASQLHNDFEPLVFSQIPSLSDLKGKLLETGAIGASLSGSGSALFGIYPDSDTARSAYDGFREIQEIQAFLTLTQKSMEESSSAP